MRLRAASTTSSSATSIVSWKKDVKLRSATSERTTHTARTLKAWRRPCSAVLYEARKRRRAESNDSALQNPGSVLLSHRLAPTVPSALESLTSVFGMGTGVTSPALPPGKNIRSAKRQSLTLSDSRHAAKSRFVAMWKNTFGMMQTAWTHPFPGALRRQRWGR